MTLMLGALLAVGIVVTGLFGLIYLGLCALHRANDTREESRHE